jgi:hypothetical protein
MYKWVSCMTEAMYEVRDSQTESLKGNEIIYEGYGLLEYDVM